MNALLPIVSYRDAKAMHGQVQTENNSSNMQSFTRLTASEAIIALRLLRLKLRTQKIVSYCGRPEFVEHIRVMFWKKENSQFAQSTVQSMINRTLSWDDAPTNEDVILAIDLLLEFAKKDAKLFSYWNC